MPIHYNVEKFRLLEQIRLIEKAGHKVTFIVPELIEHKPGNMFGNIIHYMVIFDENEDAPKNQNKTR